MIIEFDRVKKTNRSIEDVVKILKWFQENNDYKLIKFGIMDVHKWTNVYDDLINRISNNDNSPYVLSYKSPSGNPVDNINFHIGKVFSYGTEIKKAEKGLLLYITTNNDSEKHNYNKATKKLIEILEINKPLETMMKSRDEKPKTL